MQLTSRTQFYKVGTNLFKDMKDLRSLRLGKNLFRAIDHDLRAGMVAYLTKNGATNVGKLQSFFKVKPCIASHHLGILREADIVSTERNGKHILYSVNKATIKKAEAFCLTLQKTQP